MRAAAGGHRDAARVLLSHNADISFVNSAGHSAIHLAVISSDAPCVAELARAANNVIFMNLQLNYYYSIY